MFIREENEGLDKLEAHVVIIMIHVMKMHVLKLYFDTFS